MMWNFSLGLCSLLLLCHGGGTQRECADLLKLCPRINCLKGIDTALQCAECLFPNISAVCDIFKRSTKPCELYLGAEKFDCDSRDEDSQEEQTRNAPETISGDSSDSNNTAVVAVCVSVVVIVIAVLIAGVYCWRVRRVSREPKKAEDVEMRDREGNIATNTEVTENNPEPSRPNSTYCTINDIGNTNEYHVLEAQNATEFTDVDKDRELSDNCSSLTVTKHGVDRVEASNDYEYNRIEFNKRKVAKPDPSYSHLAGVATDYGGNAESDNKVLAYQYGVPIKIRNMDKMENSEYDPAKNVEPEKCDNVKERIEYTEDRVDTKTMNNEDTDRLNTDNGADDDYVIPKTDQENGTNSTGAKPRPIVNPINLHNNDLTTGVMKEQCDKNTVGEDEDDSSRNADVKNERIDDYEIAVVKNSVVSEKVDSSNNKIEQPTVCIDSNTKQIIKDGYETAIVRPDSAK